MKKKILLTLLTILFFNAWLNNNVAYSRVTSIEEIQDIRSNNWAYESVKRLVDKYGIQGYPDKTFKGNTYSSRFEMAAALDQVALEIGTQMAQLGMDKADRKDLELVIRLQKEFETELAAFKLRAEAIERKNLEQDTKIADHQVRIEKIEKVRNSRDMISLIQADQGHGESNGINYVVRVRNDTEVTFHENKPQSAWGEGKAFFRVTGAVGRFGPLASTIPSGNVINIFNDVGTDSSLYDEDTRLNGFFSNTRATTFIEQAYLSQDLNLPREGKLNLVGGLVDITNYFDCNNVANSENTQFTNIAFIINRSWGVYNGFINPAGIIQFEQPIIKDKLNFNLKAALLSNDNLKLEGALMAMYEGSLNYNIKGKEGNFRVGGYNSYVNSSDLQYVSNRISDRNGYGFYTNFDQQLYKNTKVFGRYGISDSGPARQAWNDSRQAVSFGAEFNVGDFINKRHNDVLGIAYGFSTPITNSDNNPLALNTRSEKVIETYYRAQINDMLSVGPHFQAIYSPGGFRRPLTTVIGFRSYLAF
ncbi:MAG: carbohydrate porin [Cyanobacteriota bacterium]